MTDTFARERKSTDAKALDRLLRMLRSMSQRFPRTSLLSTADGFGVRLDDGSYLHVVWNGRWSDADMRDFLALFATWLVADPGAIRHGGIPLDGASALVDAQLQRSHGQLDLPVSH